MTGRPVGFTLPLVAATVLGVVRLAQSLGDRGGEVVTVPVDLTVAPAPSGP